MGYDTDPFRDVLRSQNNTPVIPGRKNRKIKIEYDKLIYKLRTRIEQFFGKIPVLPAARGNARPVEAEKWREDGIVVDK